MSQRTIATSSRYAGVVDAAAESASVGRRLINDKQCAAKAGASVRWWRRACASGLAPWGVKIGALRRWDAAVVDQWIADGCPRVKYKKETK